MSALPRRDRAALAMAASWLGERFFRTFRPADLDVDPAPFDALLMQRDRRVGVTVAPLWDAEAPAPGASAFVSLLSEDVAEGGYVVWVPTGAQLPVDEPQRSGYRLIFERGLRGLAAGERREVRIPAILRLAKIEAEGAYVSVAGGLASRWTDLSEGVGGAFHLDSRSIHRLPEEEAEVAIVLSRVRDRAALLNPEEVTEVHVHDTWTVSRLPIDEPSGVTVIAAPPDIDAKDGTLVRRTLRRAVRRASEQRAASDVDFSVLLLEAPLAHMSDELATSSLRGMSPAAYSNIDSILLVADGRVREVLQPRQRPWERDR
ncbi:MAG: hypothetical protein R3C39_05895 [Dehalococcoidia bacterium]